MNLYAIHEREALAQLHTDLTARKTHRHTIEEMFARVAQHPAAILASAVDECRGEPCPYCCAAPWEGCRPDCSSWFDR